jgi:hypothetical protein
MSNTRTSKEPHPLLGPSSLGFLVGTNTLSSDLRKLAETSRSYRKTRDITIPIAAQFSAMILEHLSLLHAVQLPEIKAVLFDWKLKEASKKPFDSFFHPDGRVLTENEKTLQQLADALITGVCDEHNEAMRASLKRGKVHGSRDAFEFQLVEQAKAQAIRRIHELTSKVAQVLEADHVAIERAQKVAAVLRNEPQTEGWQSKFFRDFNEKEFEVGLCALLLLERLEAETESVGDRKGTLFASMVMLRDIFKIKDSREQDGSGKITLIVRE